MTEPHKTTGTPAFTDPDTFRRCVDEALMSRRSVRAFLPDPVSREVLEEILSVASRAPSGTNIQPWRVRVLTGAAKQRLSDAIVQQYDAAAGTDRAEYDYYPRQWFSPYVDRRRKLGFELYRLLGIAKDNKAAMHAQMGRNFRFFDAPVGLIFSIDRRLGQGSWLDYGFFLQSIATAARARGLHTCPQAAFADFPQTIARVLAFEEHEQLVCGMSLGYENAQAVENSLRSEREPVQAFTAFLED